MANNHKLCYEFSIFSLKICIFAKQIAVNLIIRMGIRINKICIGILFFILVP